MLLQSHSPENDLRIVRLDWARQEVGRAERDAVRQTQLIRALVQPQPHTDHPLDDAVHWTVGRGCHSVVAVHELAIEVPLKQASDWLLVVAEMHPVEALANGRWKTDVSAADVGEGDRIKCV